MHAKLISVKSQATVNPDAAARLYDARQQAKVAVLELAETILKSEVDYTVAYSKLRALMAQSERLERSLVALTDTVTNYNPS